MGRHDWLAAKAVPDFNLVGGVDIAEENAAFFRQETGAPTFASFTEARKAVQADAVLIATPDAFHAPLTIEALEAGLDVICEKPLAESLEDARLMHETAQRRGRLLMVHQQLRWSPSMYTARQLIRGGAIGIVKHLEFDMSVYSGAALVGYRSKLPYMILQDLAIHHFDLIRYLSGQECRSVYAKAWASNEEARHISTATSAYALIDMTNQVVARYTSKTRALMNQIGYGCAAVVTGSRGELAIRWEELQLQTFRGAEEGVAPRRIVPEAPVRGTWQCFADAIRSRQPTLTDSSDNLHSLAMLFAAIRSVREERVVHL